MTVYLAFSAGCTTFMVPGWAAVTVVAIAASPRLVREMARLRQAQP